MNASIAIVVILGCVIMILQSIREGQKTGRDDHFM